MAESATALAAPSLASGRRLETWFEPAYAVLCTWLVLGGYVAAWANLRPDGTDNPLGPWQEAGADAGWFAVTGLLVLILARKFAAGVPWARALPGGYSLALGAALIFGPAALIQSYWVQALPGSRGLEKLFTVPHLVMLVSIGIIVWAPLRAAVRRGDRAASWPVLVSSALLLSVATFATEYAHPLVNPWSGLAPERPADVLWWPQQDLGAASFVLQVVLQVLVALYLLRRFSLRPGSLTLLFGINGVLVAMLKPHFELIPTAIATGVAADLLVLWLRPGPERPLHLRYLAAALGSLYALFYFVNLGLVAGSSWSLELRLGMVIACGAVGWVVAMATDPGRRAGWPAEALPAEEPLWPRHHESVSPQLTKSALESLNDPQALAASPLALMPFISSGAAGAGAELGGLLTDVVRELATSKAPRDAEAGQLLLEYYVRRTGSHELIAERLHLSRPTFYRRLQRGLSLVAERLDELGEFAARHL